MIVCVCCRVSEKEILAVIAQGASSVKKVADLCGAGQCCGSCHSTIHQMIHDNERVTYQSQEVHQQVLEVSR